MRKIISSAAILLLTAGMQIVSAQDLTQAQKAAAEAAKAIADAPQEKVVEPKPTYWTNSLMTQFNFIQSAYQSWAKGGYNNVTLSTYIDANANYSKNKTSWNNRLQLDYGFLYSEDKPIVQKNKDRMLFESTWGYKAAKTLNYSVKFTFLNQFTNGYTYNTPSGYTGDQPSKKDWSDARVLKSGFFSPAIANVGLGVDWVPSKWLTVNMAPLTGGFTIVTDQSLRYIYGMNRLKGHEDDELQKDTKGLLVNGDIFHAARFEFGAQLTADAKVKINDNFEASTHLILFSNYLKNPQNIRVNWDNRFMWKLAKYFSLNVSTSLIYDDTVLIMDDGYPDGHKAIQFYEALQFGFTYTFATKKK